MSLYEWGRRGQRGVLGERNGVGPPDRDEKKKIALGLAKRQRSAFSRSPGGTQAPHPSPQIEDTPMKLDQHLQESEIRLQCTKRGSFSAARWVWQKSWRERRQERRKYLGWERMGEIRVFDPTQTSGQIESGALVKTQGYSAGKKYLRWER